MKEELIVEGVIFLSRIFFSGELAQAESAIITLINSTNLLSHLFIIHSGL